MSALATIQLKAGNPSLTTSVTVEGKKHTGYYNLEAVLARMIEKFGKVSVRWMPDSYTVYVYK